MMDNLLTVDEKIQVAEKATFPYIQRKESPNSVEYQYSFIEEDVGQFADR